MTANEYNLDQFIRIWQSSATLAEAAKQLGVTPRSLSVRASRWRRRGVKLKRFCSGRAPVNVTDLNLAIAKLNRIAKESASGE